MSMHNPKKYESYNDFQRKDALETLQKFKEKMGWKENASIIDLGCGDGSVNEILRSQIPVQYKEVIGVDMSEEMVNYANDKHGNDKTKFALMNMIGEVPEDYVERFDHAFSSFVIQFLPDQRKVFRNIYHLLKPGGSFLVIMMGSSPFHDVHYEMAKDDRWKDYLSNIDSILPKFFETENWAVKTQRYLESIGFKDCLVKDQRTETVLESFRLKEMFKSANIFKLDQDSKMFQELFDDCMQRLLNWPSRIDELTEDGTTFKAHYSLLIIYGRK